MPSALFLLLFFFSCILCLLTFGLGENECIHLQAFLLHACILVQQHSERSLIKTSHAILGRMHFLSKVFINIHW